MPSFFSAPLLKVQNFLREIVSAWDEYFVVDHNHFDSGRYGVDKAPPTLWEGHTKVEGRERNYTEHNKE